VKKIKDRRKERKGEREIAQLIRELDPRRAKKTIPPNTGGIIGLNSTPSPRVTHLPTTCFLPIRSFFFNF